MEDFVATKGVKKIVDSKDNIIDQLKELQNHSYMKGVRRFIDRVIQGNIGRKDDANSKYILYCVVKYYYGLDVVKEEKLHFSIGLPWYALSDTYDYEFVEKLVLSKDNIIDQCKLLREHRDSKDVQEYVNILQEGNDDYYESREYDYVLYCINKYYYGRKVSKVEQPEPTLRLYAYIKEKTFMEEPVDQFTPIEEIKDGDKVKILTGPFKGIPALINHVDLENHKMEATINIFEEDTMIELNEDDRILKEEDTHE